jgi:hypothetical protein
MPGDKFGAAFTSINLGHGNQNVYDNTTRWSVGASVATFYSSDRRWQQASELVVLAEEGTRGSCANWVDLLIRQEVTSRN